MQVDVYVCRVDADTVDVDHWAADLSETERHRARRFRFDRDRRFFVAAHWVRRQLLARHAGTRMPALQVDAAPGRKPAPLALPGGGWLHHSLSHAGSWIALALSRAVPVGVDIEPVRELGDPGELDALVRTTFGAAEEQVWHRVERARRHEAFFVGWTRKEAWVKATGAGLVGIAGTDRGAEVSFDLDDPQPLRTAQPAALQTIRWSGQVLISAAALQRDVQFRWHTATPADLAPHPVP